MSEKVSPKLTPDVAETQACRPLRVLVVDPDPQVAASLKKLDSLQPMQVHRASTLAVARRQMRTGKLVDLLIIEPDLPDGSGLDFAQEIRTRHRRTRIVFIAANPTVDAAVTALRLGALEWLSKPIDRRKLRTCLTAVMDQRRLDKQQAQRVRQLRRACRRIDRARADVHEQVQVLCQDLVTAYQELAGQMQQVVSVREFETLISQELQLEPLLRQTLEYLVDRLGPMNAVMFLPCATDQFSLGGHINYDCQISQAHILLQDLADTAAPRLAQVGHVLHLSDLTAKRQWLGDAADYFQHHDVITFAASHEGEALAVLILFRDRAQGFDETMCEICAGVGQALAQALVRLLRVHHRHLPDTDADVDGY